MTPAAQWHKGKAPANYLAPLAGVMGAVVSVLMPLEPMGALLAGIAPPELEESVEGVAIGAGVTVVFVVSSFLLQAPSASKAASATDVRARALCFDVNMRFPSEGWFQAGHGHYIAEHPHAKPQFNETPCFPDQRPPRMPAGAWRVM